MVSVTCPIAAPVIESFTLNDDGKPTLKWSKVDGAESYEVYRASEENGDYQKTFTTKGLTYTNTSAEEGQTYFYKVLAVPQTGDPVFSDVVSVTCTAPEPEEPSGDPIVDDVERLAGDNRYETATSVADTFKATLGVETLDNVIVAYGESYADALTGSYLSKLKNAPILLINQYSEEYIAEYINSNVNTGGTVYLLGGEGVISSGFEGTLMNSGYNVSRLGGANRYETNMNILRETGINGEELLVCSAESFADSLSASAVGKPVLIVNDALYEEQKALLTELGAERFCLIGGTGAVTDTIESELTAYGTVERLYGANRYETSKAVADRFFPDGSKTIVIASGNDFPDGLTGGVLAMLNDAPIVLVNDRNTELAKDFVVESQVSKIIAIGGKGAISDDVIDKIIY